MAATDMTFVDIQDRVLAFGYGEVDRANVKRWINQAYDDIISRRRWSWLQDTQSVSTVANQQTLVVSGLTDPPNFWGRLYPTTTNLMEPEFLDPMKFNDGLTRRPYDTGWRGVPQYYTIFDDTITFYPTPDAVYTYTLYYWRGTPELVGDSDVPLIPRQWRHVLVYGALRYAAERDRNDASVIRRTAEYEKNIANMIGAENLRQMETGLVAEMPQNYYGVFDTPRR